MEWTPDGLHEWGEGIGCVEKFAAAWRERVVVLEGLLRESEEMLHCCTTLVQARDLRKRIRAELPPNAK